MRARLLIIEPQQAKEPPGAPYLLLEDGGVTLYQAGHWLRGIPRKTLDVITESDIQELLHLRPEERPFLYLASPRELPDENLLTPTMMAWTRQWWIEEVTALARSGAIADAPAVKTAA